MLSPLGSTYPTMTKRTNSPPTLWIPEEGCQESNGASLRRKITVWFETHHPMPNQEAILSTCKEKGSNRRLEIDSFHWDANDAWANNGKV